MFADVEIITTVMHDVLVIPDTALQTEGDNQIVFVALDDNKFEKRVVKTRHGAAGTRAGARRCQSQARKS